MDSIVFLRGEHILDGLSGISKSESLRIIALKHELFNAEGTPKEVVDEKSNNLAIEFLGLMKKRKIMWRAMLN